MNLSFSHPVREEQRNGASDDVKVHRDVDVRSSRSPADDVSSAQQESAEKRVRARRTKLPLRRKVQGSDLRKHPSQCLREQ